MRRLTSWFRRPRPTVGGPAAPIPELHPVPYSPAWHQRRAHRAGTAVHVDVPDSPAGLEGGA